MVPEELNDYPFRTNVAVLGAFDRKPWVLHDWDGRYLKCFLSWKAYAVQIGGTFVFGPVLTAILAYAVLNGELSLPPWPVALFIAGMVAICWVLFLNNLGWKSEIVFDFVAREVRFSVRRWARPKYSLSMDAIAGVSVAKLRRERDDPYSGSGIGGEINGETAKRVATVWCHIVVLKTKGGEELHLVETTDQSVATEIAGIIEENI